MDHDDAQHISERYARILFDTYRASLARNRLPHTNTIVDTYLTPRVSTGEKNKRILCALLDLETYLHKDMLDWLWQKIAPDHRVREAKSKINRARESVRSIQRASSIGIDDLHLRESAAIPRTPWDIDWAYLSVIDDARFAEEKLQTRIAGAPERISDLDGLVRRFERHIAQLVDGRNS